MLCCKVGAWCMYTCGPPTQGPWHHGSPAGYNGTSAAAAAMAALFRHLLAALASNARYLCTALYCMLPEPPVLHVQLLHCAAVPHVELAGC
jgi:hypothetical protein